MPSGERLKRQLLELSIVTLITVVIWIGYGVYTALTNPIATNVTADELKPLPPPLTSELFESLREGLIIDEEALSSFSISSVVIQQPTPATEATPSPQASPSASGTGGSPSDILRQLLF